ncbi:MAG: hypothetical protein JXL67_07705 [Calditrichaeota bacterium]|nr:hypothetical protein [Calditrichota bacterium]
MKQVLCRIWILIAVLTLSCEKNPTQITNAPNPPREYEWTLDTLSVPNAFQLMMVDVWGSSADDVYVTGFSSGARGKMFHYDGSSWEAVKLHVVEGGPFPNILEFRAIWGSSSSNIYAAGAKNGDSLNIFLSFLIHYNGQQWSEIPTNGKLLQAIWGSSPSDIWTGGIEGTLLHFDGTVIQQYPLPDSIWIKSIKGFSTDDVYALAYSIGDFTRLTFYVFHWDGQTWDLQNKYVDVIEPPTFGAFALEIIGEDIYSVGYGGLFRKNRNDSTWQNIFGSSTLLFGICGSSQDNMFVVGRNGRAYHFNGIDWYRYPEIAYSDIEYSCCWTDGKELFIVGDNVSKSFALHGR